MEKKVETHRYLVQMDTRELGHLYTDCLIIGGGVAGLRAALAAAQQGQVHVLFKDTMSDSNTYYAQGGIATVQEPDDSLEDHINDTLKTGVGLCDPAIVELIIRGGPQEIEQLRQWSMPFDMNGSKPACGREGGHNHARVLHAHGDATGKHLALCLLEQVKQHPRIKIFEHCFSIDLLTEQGRCLGVLCYHPTHGYQCIWARRTVLATGGAGQIYRETTNPNGATADGMAMAYRAGAVLRDMEFMQFHPTTLYIAGAARTLITEALRGEGAKLIDRRGKRFMPEYHEMAELAPRDIVSRIIHTELAQSGETHVFLDIRHLGRQWLAEHFPTINELCREFDIDVDKEMIPVRPSAHYMIGGVKTDDHGRTNIEQLFACGEVAASGLHGANRLASNSLLEGLVLGDIVGRTIAEELTHNGDEAKHHHIISDIPDSPRTKLDIADVTNSLRSLMWRNVGIVRNGQRLEETLEIIDLWCRYVMDKVFDDPAAWQCQNMLTVSRLMTIGALSRRESRGVHYRSDFPETDDKNFQSHIEFSHAV
ncbi:MAG: L-aspartate oxidase [Sedimentisphaerales bacterium]|nr:L-aspartate oxidase [Sedimentisphaerales bacterium]